jgi:hypothetical protein
MGAGTTIDLGENHPLLPAARGIRADPAKQWRLSVIEGKPAECQLNAGWIVPAEYRNVRTEIEASSRGDSQVLQFISQADGAQFLAHPGVQGRTADRVGIAPARRAVLQRHGWIERADPDVGSPRRVRHRAPFEPGFGHVDRMPVIKTPGGHIDACMPIAHRCRHAMPGVRVPTAVPGLLNRIAVCPGHHPRSSRDHRNSPGEGRGWLPPRPAQRRPEAGAQARRRAGLPWNRSGRYRSASVDVPVRR